MEENFKSKIGFGIFIFIVIALAIGGYFFKEYILNKPVIEANIDESGEVNYKIDEDKEYIYYDNKETISEGAEIYYRDVVINLKSQTTLNEQLKKENQIYKNNIKYISDQTNIISNDLIHFNYDNLYALTFRDYATYEHDKYISLVINDFNYTCFDEKTFNKTKSYIFNIETGTLVSEDEVLNKFNTNMEKIKENIKTYLVGKQTTVDDVDLINIEETLNNFNIYAIYVNKNGKLEVSFIVKSNKIDYNDFVVLN